QIGLLLCLSDSLSAQSSRLKVANQSGSAVHEGFTIPKYEVLVAASELGRLQSLGVEVGDEVKKGARIGSLEDSVQAASVRIAMAQANMTGEWEAAKAEVKLNQLRVQKLRQLTAERMARPDELARAEADLDIALGRQKVAEEQITLNKLDLERQQLALSRRQILAPMGGVIADVFHRPGEYITPADPAVARLLVIDQLYAVFNIPVTEARNVRVNSPAKVYLRGAQQTLDARVTFVAPMIDGESGTVEVRLELDNSKRNLLSGDRCTLQVFPKLDQAGVRYPTRAVMNKGISTK
ncbi:efflux RND transporter periplasmic adaptor subunit, partial [Rubripirellula sp.]|nr:efflux RND transporter periplasmic adaptor subunit [Rubripirellula sp.]